MWKKKKLILLLFVFDLPLYSQNKATSTSTSCTKTISVCFTLGAFWSRDKQSVAQVIKIPLDNRTTLILVCKALEFSFGGLFSVLSTQRQIIEDVTAFTNGVFIVKSKWLPWEAGEVAVRDKPWENKYLIDTGNHVFKKSLADVFV